MEIETSLNRMTMKKILCTLSAICFVLSFTACDQEIDFPYEGKDKIQFKHFTTDWNEKRIYKDSLIFSFGLLDADIQTDTVNILMEFLGNGSDLDRTYNISVDHDSTTAQVDIHYEMIKNVQTFHSGRRFDTLKVVVYRKDLSTSFITPKNERIHFVLEESTDFDLGLTAGRRFTLLMNNYLSEPVWWEGNFHGALGFYHPQKWRILMSFNDGFKSPSKCPFDQNDEGRGYISGLSAYLQGVPTYDEETGDRIFMNEMVPVE